MLHLPVGATAWENVTGQDPSRYFDDVAVSDQGRVFVAAGCRDGAAEIFEVTGGTLTSKLAIDDCASYYDVGLRTGPAVTLPTDSALAAADSKLYALYFLNDYTNIHVAAIDLATGTTTTLLEDNGYNYFSSVQSVSSTPIDFTRGSGYYRLDLASGNTSYLGYAGFRGLLGNYGVGVYGLAAAPTTGCVPTTTAACLLERFRINVKFAGTKNAQQAPVNRFLAGFTYAPSTPRTIRSTSRCSTSARRRPSASRSSPPASAAPPSRRASPSSTPRTASRWS